MQIKYINNNYLVSVITPTYGRPAKLIKALESVANQKYQNLEHIIVDDNGLNTPNQLKTAKIISKFAKNNIIYKTLKVNSGACIARNKAIICAQGRYVTFLDDDDEMPPLYLETFIKNIHYLKNKKSSLSFLFIPYHYSLLAKSLIGIDQILYRNFIGNSIFIERFKLESISFDSSLPSAQDYDLWIRLIKEYGPAKSIRGSAIKLNKIGHRISNGAKVSKGYKAIIDKYSHIMKKKHIISQVLSIDIALNTIKVTNLYKYGLTLTLLRAIKFLVIKTFSARLFRKIY